MNDGPPAGLPVQMRLTSVQSRSITLTPPLLSSFPLADPGFEYTRRGFIDVGRVQSVIRVWGGLDNPIFIRLDRESGVWRATGWGIRATELPFAVSELLSWRDPIEQFYSQTRSEPTLCGVAERFPGLRLPRDGSLYESLVHAVIGQQLSVSAAASIEARLTDAGRAWTLVDGIRATHVPGPARLLAMDSSEFSKIGLSRAKRAAIIGIATAARSGHLDPVRDFQRGDPEAAIGRLDELRGVGRWTAENALLRGAGRRDLFMAGDLGVRSALAAYGAVPREASEDE